jgi:hypothetical protein
MKLYIGNYWVPFPSSEYGGMWAVAAENNEQAIELLEKQCGSWEEDYLHLIREAVESATVFELDAAGEYQSGIVDTFFT